MLTAVTSLRGGLPMEPLRFTSGGNEYFCINEDGPGLDWVEMKLNQVRGVTVVRNVGFDSISLRVSRGVDSVLLHDDPMAAAIVIAWPAEEPKSELLADILQVLSDGLAEL
jgi:hypothetical protein